MKTLTLTSVLLFMTILTVKGQTAKDSCLVTINKVVSAVSSDPMDLVTATNLIKNDIAGCIITALSEHESYKASVKNIYASWYPWVYHTNPAKEKLFQAFYEKWNGKSPTPDFHKAIKEEMVATDTAFFDKVDSEGVPIDYKNWLFCKQYDEKNLRDFMDAIKNL